MTEQHKHMEPTAELIRLYLEGKLDDKTMHALEKQALDDPFLAEALDGFAEAPEAAAGHHLQDLQARLSQRVSGKAAPKVRRLNYYWAAAAAMLIFISTGLYMFMNPAKERSPLAVNKQFKPDTAAAGSAVPEDLTNNVPPAAESEAAPVTTFKTPPATRADAVQGATVANVPVTEVAVSEAEADKQDLVAMLKEKQAAKEEHRLEHAKMRAVAMDVRRDSLAYNKAFAFSVDGAKADSFLYKNKNLSLSAKTAGDSLTAKPGRGYLGVLEDKATGVAAASSVPAPLPLKRNVRGVVTDMNKIPLPGVSVREKGSNNWALTDEQGRFSLKLDSSRQSDLTLAGIGYNPKDLKINPQQNNLSISLNENAAALNDVVVVGYGARKKALSRAKVAAEPEDGFEEFNDYLANNVRYTTQMSQANVDDSVEVSFDVNSDGTIGQFKIERSLHAPKDINKIAHAEAIRVIKDGPKWLPASKSKKKVRVKVFVPFRRKTAEAKE
ncbi:carboxypeptidase-like regulatory domain-containing protein [uncultured Chitinophaga sp.]|uniref:carboxypeptidase-like regulatory domain-containing protein n=1 Tax=uncultured Chitinophaga sp. TaxID=339340 RepID=UPI0025D25F89|nr:carboxypeptidase-like regulatory domain-containing protein [uncultured Chitinophaga sp.]